ncbi:hypothetical protein C1645_124120 [Glomus cerebriforme]|uniref:Uncharacterized protein n=1 Tax=Glomus cerebriforme TaxID=658196 RepID=A0A397S9T5_9GLOM|nr:hypothetical protein C1645_124120 [Glomus cerebriforme]
MRDDQAELVIPNKEVANQWKSWIFERTNEVYESLFKKDIKKFCEQFPSLYMDMLSCYDFADLKRNKLYEIWYHLFVLGTLTIFHGNDYYVLSNCEFGKGHNDVRIIPLNKKDTSIIFEFKLAKSDDCNEMEKSAKEGLDQIVNKNYQANIQNHVKMIVEVAIAFHKKSAFVSAHLLKHKKNRLLANDTWEEVEVAKLKYLQIQRDIVNNFSERERVSVSVSKNKKDISLDLPNRCKAFTKKNNRCNNIVKSGDYCHVHRD